MKTVTITSKWLNQFPPIRRADVVKHIYSLAAQFGWEVRVAGQRWR